MAAFSFLHPLAAARLRVPMRFTRVCSPVHCKDMIMNMKTALLFVCACFLTLRASSQYSQTVTPLLDTQAGVMKELPPRIGDVKGSVYLNEEWTKSDLYLKPGSSSGNKIENVPIRLDLENNALEVLTTAGIRLLDDSKVDRFEFADPQTGERSMYVNGSQFTVDGAPLSGFCKVSGENVKVIRCDYLEVLKPNYNVSMDVGSKDEQIIKKYKLYLSKDGETVSCNKKSLYAMMADKATAIKKFVKAERIRISKEEGLRKVAAYYDELH